MNNLRDLIKYMNSTDGFCANGKSWCDSKSLYYSATQKNRHHSKNYKTKTNLKCFILLTFTQIAIHAWILTWSNDKNKSDSFIHTKLHFVQHNKKMKKKITTIDQIILLTTTTTMKITTKTMVIADYRSQY